MKNVMQGMAAMMLAVGTLCFAGTAAAQVNSMPGDLIINEYNAVGPEKILEGTDGDTFFGFATGNGGDWIELVVTRDGVDLRGWTITWQNDDPDTGTLTFSNNLLWSNMQAGTIITARVGDSNDTSFNGCSGGDWWIRVNANDTTYFSQTGHAFKTDNDGWRATIKDDLGTVVQNQVGENGETDPSIIWAGSGVGSQEVGKLEANPTANASNYVDGNCSSFGEENCWNDGASTQNFTSLRACQ
jgi:hypothetical protein